VSKAKRRTKRRAGPNTTEVAAAGTLAGIERAEQAADLKHYVAMLDAQIQGKRPTREQMRAARRYIETVVIPQALSRVPKWLYVQMSGREHRTLDRQAESRGLPVKGKYVNLSRIIRWLHDFLASPSVRKPSLVNGEDPLMVGGENSPAMERYRAARASLAELKLEERKGTLLSREDARERLSRLATIMRATGDHLQRECGPKALAIWDEGLDLFDKELDRWKNNGKLKRGPGR